MPTLKDIAERVGVSISTVSRVLADDSNRSSSSGTKRKIWDAAQELGYMAKVPPQDQAAVKKSDASYPPCRDGATIPIFRLFLKGLRRNWPVTDTRSLLPTRKKICKK